MSKVDQKRNWVKLKSVQTLLRIACLANRKSYVVIIYANACEKLTKKWKCIKLKSVQILLKSVKILPKVKFIQILLKITSIFPNLTFEGHPRSKVIQLKNHEVNWKTIYMYMTSYVFQVNFGHDMHHSEDTAH